MSSEIELQVRQVIARTFKLAADSDGADWRMGNPAEWDSVGHMGLILDLEDEFGVRFATYEVATMQTIPDIVRALAARTSG